jgi:hypothetical protein
MERVTDPADPERCQGAAPDGQCWNRAEHGTHKCRAHGGKSTAEQEELGIYRLKNARYRERLAQMRGSRHEDVKSLRDEIRLTRILIEERYNAINSDTDLIVSCPAISNLLLTLERLMKTSQTLEESLNVLVSRSSIIVLGKEIVTILIEELRGIEDYEDRVDRITDRLFVTLEQTANVES